MKGKVRVRVRVETMVRVRKCGVVMRAEYIARVGVRVSRNGA